MKATAPEAPIDIYFRWVRVRGLDHLIASVDGEDIEYRQCRGTTESDERLLRKAVLKRVRRLRRGNAKEWARPYLGPTP